MYLIGTVSKNLTNTLRQNVVGLTDEKCEVINYGIEVILSDLSKIVLMLFAAWSLGIIEYILIAMACCAILRSFSGGVHAKTWTGCLLANSVSLFGVVYIASAYQIYNSVYINITIYFVALFAFYMYAPSDHENKPLVSKKQRKRLRIGSFISLGILIISSIIINNSYVTNIIIFSIVVQIISILPMTYRLTRNRYGS